MELSQEIKEFLEKLEQNGFEATIVGEYVRDYILKKIPNKIEIITNAKKKDIGSIVDKVIPLSENKVLVLIDDKEYVVKIYDNDIKNELEKRVFSVNTISYNLKDGIVDLFGGRKDIENKVIKVVKNNFECFKEEPTLILKCISLASSLDFVIEDETLKAISECKELLKNAQNDKIRIELNNIFSSENPNIGIEYLIKTGIYEVLFDKTYETYELQKQVIRNRCKDIDLLELSKEESIEVMLAILIYKLDDTTMSLECLYDFLEKYNYPESISKNAINIMRCIDLLPDNIDDANDKNIRKIVVRISNLYPLYLKVINAIFYSVKNDIAKYIINKIYEIYEDNNFKRRRELNITKKQLLELGIPRGKAIDLALFELANVIDKKPALNTEENLIGYVKKAGVESFIKSNSYFKLRQNAMQRLKSDLILNDRLLVESEKLDKKIQKINM